jgi:hypothetical protein
VIGVHEEGQHIDTQYVNLICEYHSNGADPPKTETFHNAKLNVPSLPGPYPIICPVQEHYEAGSRPISALERN